MITAYNFNHVGIRKRPLDQRFLNSNRNYVYYLVDEEVPLPLQNHSILLEKQIDSVLHKAGKCFFAEWSFFLAEAKHNFCSYPFFVVSSRFYEKNKWLAKDLNAEWDCLFTYLEKYGWGYLPSLDRPLSWLKLEWEKKIKKEVWKYKFFPYTAKAFHLVEEIFGIKVPTEYRYISNIFCNYIGFKSRENLIKYVEFYKPLFHHFFDDNYCQKCDFSSYVRPTGYFKNEKPFTFILQLFSHLYFFKSGQKFFTLHYDGYYEVNERKTLSKKICNIRRTLLWLITKRHLQWRWRSLKSQETLLAIRAKILRWIKKKKSFFF